MRDFSKILKSAPAEENLLPLLESCKDSILITCLRILCLMDPHRGKDKVSVLISEEIAELTEIPLYSRLEMLTKMVLLRE